MQSAAALLESLVRIPSPTGSEAAAVDAYVHAARALGFDAWIDDAGNGHAARGEGPEVLLLGHIDTVPGTIPVRVEGGDLWGRGSVDAKGCLVTFLHAAVDVPSGIRWHVVAAVDEEGTSRGAKALRALHPVAVVIGEPSGWDRVAIAYRGIVRVTLRGSATVHHGGVPLASIADRAVAAWQDIRTGLPIDDGFDDAWARIDELRTDGDGLDETALLRGQVRLPASVTARAATELIEAAARRHGLDADIAEALDAATPTTEPLASCLRAAIRTAGGVPRLVRKTGTCDMNHTTTWWKVPTVAYGPGDPRLDHTPEERLPLADLDRAVAVLGDALGRLAGVLAAVPLQADRAA